MISKFTQEILNWAKLHPDDETSIFFRDALQRKKEESKKWRLIATAFENYEFRDKDLKARRFETIDFHARSCWRCR